MLLYIGLDPQFRGRGLGGALNSESLWGCAAPASTQYEDSTTEDNAAMRRIFQSAGCEKVASSAVFVRFG